MDTAHGKNIGKMYYMNTKHAFIKHVSTKFGSPVGNFLNLRKLKVPSVCDEVLNDGLNGAGFFIRFLKRE